MKNYTLSLLILLATIFSTDAFSWTYREWERSDVNLPDLEMNNLRFTNRASCALDSKKQTESAFLLVTNTDVAKGLYKLANNTGNENTKELIEMGVGVFRYSIIEMMDFIHQKLMNGELPLLPVDLSKSEIAKNYRQNMKSCKSDPNCKGLNLYLGEIWRIATDKKLTTAQKQNALYRFDHFDSSKHFINLDMLKVQNDNKLTCHYLKKFSPLQAHLYGTKPNESVFNAMAEVSLKREDYLGDCRDVKNIRNLQAAAYQFEINEFKSKAFEEVGFDYWNSLKSTFLLLIDILPK